MALAAGERVHPARRRNRRSAVGRVLRKGESGVTRLLKLECVVGENTGEASVESHVLLHLKAKKIADIHARLKNLAADVVEGQVMIQGVLSKQVFFVGEDDRIRHQAEDVPFATFIDIPGARAGMSAHIQGAIAKVTHRLDSFHELHTRAILQFFAKVTEEQQLNVVEAVDGPLCKAEAVVGETSQATPVEALVELERPAIKVRDVRVLVESVTAEASDDQVIFSGNVVCNFFYIGASNTEFFQEERVPFSGIADVGGCRCGDNVTIRPSIVRVDRFLTSGTHVRLRAILSVFIKVTQTCEVNVATDPEGPLVVASRVVGNSSRQVMVENTTDLNIPALKVQDITARVQDLSTEVIANKVIITGVLHKQIFFVGPDQVVHHQGEDVAFSTFIDCPGAQPWMSAGVTPLVEHVGWQLTERVSELEHAYETYDVYEVYGPYGVEEKEAPLFARLAQKTIIQLNCRVSEDAQVHIAVDPDCGLIIADAS